MNGKLRFAFALVFFLGAVALAATLLGRFSPTELKTPSCLFHEIFGLYCPSCGSTRAVRRILHGDLVGAFRYNPLLVLFSPYLIVGAVDFFRGLWRGNFPYRRGSLTLAYAGAALIIVFAVARNLPFDWCDVLRPPSSVGL